MTEIANYEFFRIIKLYRHPGRKTDIFVVENRRTGDTLGRILWYGAWRQYCFEAEPGAIWSASCLAELVLFLDKLKAERKGKA